MSDFLADNNLCGQAILKIVAKGNGIVAELLKLKDCVPQVYRLESKADILKYGEIICDLSYFTASEAYEAKIEKDQALSELDEEFRQNYVELLSSFYFLFESIFKYATELSRFVEDVQEGYYIQMSLETILYDKEGKQILTEAIYLYGVMLLLTDHYIDGIVRERMLTSFYRYAGVFHQSETHLDEVCKLFRSTGFSSKSKKPLTYPQDYFARIPISEIFIRMVIGVLRSDDIYHQVGSAYPLPEHRSTAFGTQSAMLAVILFFCPSMLHSESATMREITDKFFPDNWIVPIYMGFHSNLIEAWDSFKAAKLALGNTVDVARVKQIAVEKGPKILSLKLETDNVLKDDVLTEENILQKVSKVIQLLRECNVTLRWIILHCSTPIGSDNIKKVKQTRDIVLSETKFDPEKVLQLLLNVAQLELKVKDLFQKLLAEKRERWLECQKEAKERIQELAEVFGGSKPLSRIEKNEKLNQWLLVKVTQVEALNFDKIQESGRKTVELIKAFGDMLEFHGLESVVQVREWVSETVSCFHKMLRTGSINEDKLVTIQIIEDLGYAWGNLIDVYTPHMQALIQKDPFSVSRLRAVFLKLSSAMNLPLMRIGQSKSNKLLVKVSSYYSEDLVSYVQKVLQIIPQTVFSILHEIIELLTTSVKELPTRLDKDKIKDYAQLEDRQKVSFRTHHMSVLAEGILLMQKTLVGIIRIDPKLLLENGIRKELVSQVCDLFHSTLSFQARNNSGSREATLKNKLEHIAKRVDGIRRSFEYIGDYVNSDGLKIFQEEFSRVFHFTTEQESNPFSKIKILPFQSDYQSKDIQIPLSIVNSSIASPSGDLDFFAVTFLGRLANELILLTDPKSTMFMMATNSWYDLKTHAPVLTPEYFRIMENGLGIPGLNGLDKIFSFMIVDMLQKLLKIFRKELVEKSITRDFLVSLDPLLTPSTKLIEYPLKQYTTWHSKAVKPNTNPNTIGIFQRIGQLQLLRRRIRYQLRVSASLQAKHIYNTMNTMNMVITEMCLSGEKSSTSLEGPSEEDISELTCVVASLSEPLGLYEPFAKVYISTDALPNISLYLALIMINQIHKLVYSKSSGSLICRKISDPFDGMVFVVSMSTVLTQLHPTHSKSFLGYICQYLNSMLVHANSNSQGGQPSKEDLQEISALFYFLVSFSRVSPRQEEVILWIKQTVPSWEILPIVIRPILE